MEAAGGGLWGQRGRARKWQGWSLGAGRVEGRGPAETVQTQAPPMLMLSCGCLEILRSWPQGVRPHLLPAPRWEAAARGVGH